MTQFFASYAEKLKSVDGSRTEDLWGRKLAMLQLCHNRYPCLFLVKGSNRSVVANCRVRVYIPPTNKLIRQKQRFFLKKSTKAGIFCLFSSFSQHNDIIVQKSVDGVLGTQTWGGRMVGTDESTELWRHPQKTTVLPTAKWWIGGR